MTFQSQYLCTTSSARFLDKDRYLLFTSFTLSSVWGQPTYYIHLIKIQKMAVTNFDDVIKSPSDKRDYRALILENEMKVLLTSESNCGKAAASLSVAIGSMNDPPDLPGLAHLCEHMLFFESLNGASATLEEVKGYGKFISENGGNCNANTAKDQTNYHFDVASSSFKEALTRFAKFFGEPPAFPEVALEKEIKVVDSEFKNKLNNDAWRKSAVDACTAKLGHPFNHFSTGNKDSLSDVPSQNAVNVLERLKKFHSQYYSPNVMSLVVLGQESLDELEKLVTFLFSSVKNCNIQLPKWTENPYGPEECGTRIDILPISDVRDLYINFPIPDPRPFYKTFPHGYLTTTLGHKGRGSLYSLLHEKNWVNNNSVNSSIPARGFGNFSVGLQLTLDGLEHIDEIVGYLFQYIKVLKDAGPQKYIWDEMKMLAKTQFEFEDQDNSIDFVQRISSLMHVYPLPSVLSVGYVITEYDSALIEKYLNCLNPDNCRIMTIAKKNMSTALSVEKWYGVKYNVMKLPAEIIDNWKVPSANDSFSLPRKNEFIPTIFSLKPLEESYTKKPVDILNTDLNVVWFLQNKELNIPKAFLRVEIFSPLPMMDPETNNYNHLFWTTLKDSLTEELYGAGLAGLSYTIKGTMYGAEITLDGFDEKIGTLVEKTFNKIFKCTLTQGRFRCALQAYAVALMNWANQQPYSQVPYYMSLLLREKRFSNAELIKFLTTTKFHEETLEKYRSLFLSKLKLEWFISGNLTKKEALDIVNTCEQILEQYGTKSLSPCQTLRFREVDLTPGSAFTYKVEDKCHKSSSCTVLLQIGTCNLLENVLLELFDQIVHQPCFNQLRNQENLGYIVRTGIRKCSGTQGFQIVVQGDQHPSFVEKRINVFLSSLTAILHSMSEEEFKKHKAAVALRKKDIPKKLSTQSIRIWNNEIYTREYEFDRIDKEMELLETITKEQIKPFVAKYIHPDSKLRKYLALYLTPSQDEHTIVEKIIEMNNIEIKDITKWKTQMGLFPLFHSHLCAT